ncbi:G-alpha-domain-containing protein [Punctularia strigosozonata HHB-11173 SS5]|uniref:G-alpha-domain-containing protein n=1 Tax=Punctularia strigosozonata (strain HHB-11173) TaxID=741275 RepID=UPI0004417301|nr:G-alpha-domain-containing protein [Punctularia strigosozonata HHB-11173 SS5]EIN14248.1 G-alpha-domain-containing protein [Punctularia strigosozonata HHB-11173 SS5]
MRSRLQPNRPRSHSFSHDPHDPLLVFTQPPEDETPEERELRLRAEHAAKMRSEAIDEELRAERVQRKKRREVKVLLLGQSESGKSTTLKQFQLLHTPETFHAERIAWRSVIYLNLVRSIHQNGLQNGLSDEVDVDSIDAASVIISAEPRSPSSLSFSPIPNFERYRRRLSPLLELETKLIHQLSSPDDDDDGEATRLDPPPVASSSQQQVVFPPWNNADANHSSPHLSAAMSGLTINTAVAANGRPSPPLSPSPSTPRSELTLHSTSTWRKALSLGGRMLRGPQNPQNDYSNEVRGWWEDPDDPVHILNACSVTMVELWQDPNVRRRLQERRLRLEESSGFYLDDIHRITAKRYIPSDDDVLKARLKTVGVTEHCFTLKPSDVGHGFNSTLDWKIYDVGGARHQRQAWAPYFTDVNAIIFLAPISAFDQVLSEDPTVNRLEDSFLLWKAVVANKLMQNVNIILFLNKCDLLQKKLASGVKLSRYMSGYGNRPNDYESVARHFKQKFYAIHQSFSPNKERDLFISLTSVIDTRRTRLIIHQVRDNILKANLKHSHFV